MTPAARYTLCHEVVVNVPILANCLKVRTVARIAIPAGIQAEVGAIARRLIEGVVEIDHVVDLVRGHQQRRVVSTVGPHAAIGYILPIRPGAPYHS